MSHTLVCLLYANPTGLDEMLNQTRTTSQLTDRQAERQNRIEQAHDLMMIEDARELLADNRSQNRRHADGSAFPDSSDTGATAMGDINLGDTHIHTHEQPKRKSNPLVPLAIAGASLLTGGALGPLAIGSIASMFKDSGPVIQQEADPPVDYTYQEPVLTISGDDGPELNAPE